MSLSPRANALAAALLLGLIAPARAGAEEELGPIDCFERAKKHVSLNEEQALALCQGARSVAPALCYERARARTFLDLEDAVSLCICATSTVPVDCYWRARQSTHLDESGLVQLCSPPASKDIFLGCLVPYWRTPP